MSKFASLLLVITSVARGDLAGPEGVKQLYEQAHESLDAPSSEAPFYLTTSNLHRIEEGNAALYFP